MLLVGVAVKRLKYPFILSIILFSSRVFALGAHVHGALNLDIAVDNKQVLVMLKTPMDTFVGGHPRSKRKEKLKEMKKNWSEKSSVFFNFEQSNCQRKDFQWKKLSGDEEDHSDIEAEFMIECNSNVGGSRLGVFLKKYFPRIETIHLQLIDHKGKTTVKKYRSDFFQLLL
jgi:hypothetical protein